LSIRRFTPVLGAAIAGAALFAASTPVAHAAADNDPLGRAVAQLKSHAAAAGFTPGQTFTLKNVLADPDGTRTATLSAAADLYGSGSTEYAAVAAAWSAVSVA